MFSSPYDSPRPHGVRRLPAPGQLDISPLTGQATVLTTRGDQPHGSYHLGTYISPRPHGLKHLHAPGQQDYSPVTGTRPQGEVEAATQASAPEAVGVHPGIRMVPAPRPGLELAPIMGFPGIGTTEPFDCERVLPHKKELGIRHFMDHDPLCIKAIPWDLDDLRRRNELKHPQAWKQNPTRALITGDLALAQQVMSHEPDFITRNVKGEFSPTRYRRESEIPGLGQMGRQVDTHHVVRKKSITNPEPLWPSAPHHKTILEQARVWSHC